MNQSSIVQRILPTNVANNLTVNPERGMKIGEIMLGKGRLTPMQIERILVDQAQSKLRFGEIAIKLGFATPRDVEEALAQQFGYSRSDVST